MEIPVQNFWRHPMFRIRFFFWLMALSLVLSACGRVAGTKGAQRQRVAVAIDAQKTGAPIPKVSFGAFMEPATTEVWAEMLYDRKFAYPINSQQEPEQPSGFARQRRNPWRPVGPDSVVAMDKEKPFVGDQTPLIKLEGGTPHGIRQAGLVLRQGKSYTGRIVLAGDPGAKVEVSLVWGANPADRETVPIRPLTGKYRTFPLKFTSKADAEDGRLEIVGTGTGTLHIGAVSLMPADNIQGYRAGMIKYLKEMGLSLARWPGGNFVSAYDWRDGIGDPDKRPPLIGPVRPTLETNDVGIDEFMVMCRLLGIEPYVAINSGFGEARSAAELVEYVNGSVETAMGKLRAANGHPQPYKVKYWGIGNEMYGDWQYGYMPLYQYWDKHALITKAMKKVDPTIQVSASGATPGETSWCAVDIKTFFAGVSPSTYVTFWTNGPLHDFPYQLGDPDQDWSGGLLAHAADSIDLLAEHFYSNVDLVYDPKKDKEKWVESQDPLELSVRRLPNRLVCVFDTWDEYQKRIPSLKGKNIKFAFDEWGPRLRKIGGGQYDNMKSPLSMALAFHEMFRHSEMIGLSALTDGFRGVLTDATGDAVGFRALGLVFKMFREHLCENMPVAVSGNSPQIQTKGTMGVDQCARPSGSPTYPLDVLAALSADRKKLTVSVVNPTESAQELALDVTGVQLAGAGKLWQIAAPSVDTVNVAGQKPAIALMELSVSEAPNRLAVPPISVNVYEFEVR